MGPGADDLAWDGGAAALLGTSAGLRALIIVVPRTGPELFPLVLARVAGLIIFGGCRSAGRGVTHEVRMINQDPPASSGEEVINAVEAAASQLGLKHRRMVSRAYHDSLFMAQVTPMGMVFIPCRDGVSHRPDEYASPQDIEKGVKTLALAMARLSMD